MSSITLDRTQSQALQQPDSSPITLDKVTDVTPPVTSVTVENVQSKNADIPKMASVNIKLDPPAAAVNDKVHGLTLKGMATIQKAVGAFASALHFVGEITRSSKVTVIADDAADFELQLSKLTEELKGTQFSLKKHDLTIAKARHEQEMAQNAEKINESEAAAQSAKKAGLASDILGWLGAAVSIIVGVATIIASGGALAAAGALMIVGGVMSAVNQGVQLSDASDGAKKVFGYISMAVELVASLTAAVLTGGATIAAKVGLKSLATAAAKSVPAAAKQFSFVATGADVITGAAQGATKVGSSVTGSKAASIQSDLSNMRADMDANRFKIDKIQEALEQMMDEFQDLVSIVSKMIENNFQSSRQILVNTPVNG